MRACVRACVHAWLCVCACDVCMMVDRLVPVTRRLWQLTKVSVVVCVRVCVCACVHACVVMCVCACACMSACMRACVCACVFLRDGRSTRARHETSMAAHQAQCVRASVWECMLTCFN